MSLWFIIMINHIFLINQCNCWFTYRFVEASPRMARTCLFKQTTTHHPSKKPSTKSLGKRSTSQVWPMTDSDPKSSLCLIPWTQKHFGSYRTSFQGIVWTWIWWKLRAKIPKSRNHTFGPQIKVVKTTMWGRTLGRQVSARQVSINKIYHVNM